jgi:hypothetical protein
MAGPLLFALLLVRASVCSGPVHLLFIERTTRSSMACSCLPVNSGYLHINGMQLWCCLGRGVSSIPLSHAPMQLCLSVMATFKKKDGHLFAQGPHARPVKQLLGCCPQEPAGA